MSVDRSLAVLDVPTRLSQLLVAALTERSTEIEAEVWESALRCDEEIADASSLISTAKTCSQKYCKLAQSSWTVTLLPTEHVYGQGGTVTHAVARLDG